MAKKNLNFCIGDWLKDPNLSLCSPATRGIWFDIICRMHESETGKLIANLQQLSRLSRCTERDISLALEELKNSCAADIYNNDGIITIICRRMQRNAELIAKRKQSGSKGGSKTDSKREATPFDLLSNVPLVPSSPPHTPPLTPLSPLPLNLDEQAHAKVLAFAKSEGIAISDADWFFWKGQGNGWTNGGKQILDWKATLRSWKRAGYLPSQKQKATSQFSTVKPKLSAPVYPKLSEYREPTEEELEKAREIAHQETAKLKAQFNL